MANTHETIADIIRKIRAEANSIEESARGSLKVGEDLNGMPFTESDLESALDLAETKRKEADRLEAANRRELGNAAKLREALEHMVRAETYGSMERDDLCGRCLEKMFAKCNHDGTCWVDKAITALAAPPRNCDVGTAEELYGRYEKFCCSHYNCDGDDCTKCPLSQPTCKFAWAQMPYKEGGAK